MFFLGSIGGFLPYILALSLTIVWGGHAGIPYLASDSTPESANEIIKPVSSPVDCKTNLKFENQIITDKTELVPLSFCTPEKLFSICSFRLFDRADPGISSLRAPPISLF